MSVLVDSSVWISYFRGSEKTDTVDFLIEENILIINDLILAELTPALHLRREKALIGLLNAIKRYPMNIDWERITRMQITCLQKGINGIGIPDLLIAQNAIDNHLQLLTLDKHFSMLAKHTPLSVYEQ